jgi:membrane-bound metal-dependent hydrolase YbcI (DUF457 family)
LPSSFLISGLLQEVEQHMLVGHYAVGLAAKSAEPKVDLGTLVLAAMIPDLAWCVFMIVGIEHVQFGPGLGAGNYLHATNIAMSHSLLMNAIWAALLAAAYGSWKHYLRGALFVFMAGLSHWFLDFISHRPDMPLAPGVAKSYGLGLWTSIPATLILEGGFWLFAIILYIRATRAKSRVGNYAFWGGVVVLSLLWWNNIAGPPPPNPRTAPVASLVLFSISIAWAYWMNRLRPARLGVSHDGR